MIMLYAVRMRLVFISSVTAMTPLRTISTRTGVMRASLMAIAPDLDQKIAQRVHGHGVAGHENSRRGMFLDDRGAGNAIAGEKIFAGKGGCRNKAVAKIALTRTASRLKRR